MNEPVENSVDYVNNSPEEPLPPLTWRDAATPILALALACLYRHVFALENMWDYLPGLGVPVFVAAYFAAVFLTLGKRVHLSAASLAMTAASLTLAVCCWLYSSLGLTILNCFIILFTAAGATFLLSGRSRYDLRDARIIPETVRLSFLALCSRLSHPFRLLSRVAKPARFIMSRVFLALLISLPLLAVVLALLASADAVFGSIFETLGSRLEKLSLGNTLWKTVRTLILTLLIASGLYFIAEAPAQEAETASPKKCPAALYFLLPTILLDVVYVLFCAIQIKYLFGGAEAAAMAGGWAEYAREGFFQLVAVAIINLGVCLLGCREDRLAGKGGLILRLANVLMLLLTLIILLSAARRMQLYILAYGLSILRLMTLWGILVILAGLLAAGWKLFRPRFSFFRVFGPFLLAAWCLFSLMNPCGLIARYNVNRYLDGSLKQVDTRYLARLGTDTLPALSRLEEETGLGEDAIASILEDMEGERDWSQHKLSYRHLREG